MSKPPFKMRTFPDHPAISPEMLKKAEDAWREYYEANPEALKDRQQLEIDTIENMVQQYVDQYGFRPDEYPEKWWEKNE